MCRVAADSGGVLWESASISESDYSRQVLLSAVQGHHHAREIEGHGVGCKEVVPHASGDKEPQRVLPGIWPVKDARNFGFADVSEGELLHDIRHGGERAAAALPGRSVLL